MPPPVLAQAEDAFPVRSRRPAPGMRSRRRRSGFPWLRLCFGTGAVAALIVLAKQPEAPLSGAPIWAAVEPAPTTAPQPNWEPVTLSAPAYAIAAPDLQELPLAYEARRDREGAREDVLTFGTVEDASRLYARVVARQAPASGEARFYIDLARRAAEAGLAVARSAPATGLATKFGPAEVADVALSGAADRACLAFRLSRPEVAWRIGGWLCGAGGEPPSGRQLTCIIDGLSLRSAENAALGGLFTDAERHRDPSCAPPPRVAEAMKPATPGRGARRR